MYQFSSNRCKNTTTEPLALLAVTTELIECFRFFKSCLQKAFSEIFETIKSIKTKQPPPHHPLSFQAARTQNLNTVASARELRATRSVHFPFSVLQRVTGFILCPRSSASIISSVMLQGKKRKKEKSSSHSSLADAVKNVNVCSLLC